MNPRAHRSTARLGSRGPDAPLRTVSLVRSNGYRTARRLGSELPGLALLGTCGVLHTVARFWLVVRLLLHNSREIFYAGNLLRPITSPRARVDSEKEDRAPCGNAHLEWSRSHGDLRSS